MIDASTAHATPDRAIQAPLFTVVMPCYRARDTIAASVASVLAQTEPRFELIVVDDGSPDDSRSVAMAAAKGDPRVRSIRQENAGPAAARNRGAEAGTGPLIAFLDSDDVWAPETLARHRDHFAANRDVGVSFGRVRFFDAAMTRAGRVSAHVPRLSLIQILGENPLCTTSNLVARRTVWNQIGGFDVAMTHAEDQEWVVRVVAGTGWTVAGVDAALVHYRMSARGLSADLAAMDAGWRTMMERARHHAPTAVAAAERPARALFERYLARRALRTGQDPKRALRHLRQAMLLSPRALFANGPRRTLLTAAGAIAAALVPTALIRGAISR